MKIKVNKNDLVKEKSVIFNKTRTEKSRFYLIFDRIEGDCAVGKTFPEKSKRQREEIIRLEDTGSKVSLLSFRKYSDEFIVTKKIGRLNKFLCSKKMNRSFSRSLNQADFFKTYEEAEVFASKYKGKVIDHKKAVKFHNGNRCN